MKSTMLIAMVALGAFLVFAQEPKGRTASTGQKSMSADMSEACKTMMAKRDQMMAEMKSMDASLDRKLAAMNAASGSAKVEAMAGVVNELVSERKKMEQNMMTMHADMMQHMAAHMMAGKESMMNCPMMKSESPTKSGAR